MKFKLLFTLFLMTSSVYAYEVGEMVKCQGYVELKNKERSYYELKGKVLKVEGRHFLIYGFTPVFSSKRLHKVLKISCVRPDEEFITDVTETKEEVTQPEPEVVVKEVTIEDVSDKGQVFENFSADPLPVEEETVKETSKEERPASKTISMNRESTPINSRAAAKESPQKDQRSSDCNNLMERDAAHILKCFIKDGYGSF